MALSAASMRQKIKTARQGLANDDLDGHLEALCQGIIDEIQPELDAMKTAYNAHTHTDSQGGATSPPDEQMS